MNRIIPSLLVIVVVSVSFCISFVTFAESPAVQRPPVSSEKPNPLVRQVVRPKCIFPKDSGYPYSPDGFRTGQSVSLCIKYECEGTESVGPVDIVVQDESGTWLAQKTTTTLMAGKHEITMSIRPKGNSKIITIIKYQGKEVFKRIDTPFGREWGIGASPGVLLSEPIMK